MKFKFLASAILFPLVFIACEETVEYVSDDLSPTTPETAAAAITPASGSSELFASGARIDNAAQEVKLAFSSTRAWSVSTDGAGWLIVAPTSGPAGDAVVTVKVSYNEGVDERSSTVTVASSGITKPVTITQEGRAVVKVETVTISEPSLNLYPGDKATLTASYSPEDAENAVITWSTSDENVATVDGGLVTAVAVGTATITAEAGGKSATCTVTVTKKPIPVESVTLSQNEGAILIDETLTLTATINPEDADDQTLVWTSSDEAVATVTDGVVTGKGEGTADITVTVGGKSDVCKVTVNKAPVPVESVTLSETEIEILVGKTFTLTATVGPDDAYDKTVTWKSEDETVATVVDGVVTGVGKGETTITATAGEKSATCKVTVKLDGSHGEDLNDPVDVDPWK
ncbi:MAG: Ig-like domain-containing protein [Bacteroidales bacterium]|nr:Ig-like domain-containing protein [Bacteroidales bacterium]